MMSTQTALLSAALVLLAPMTTSGAPAAQERQEREGRETQEQQQREREQAERERAERERREQEQRERAERERAQGEQSQGQGAGATGQAGGQADAALLANLESEFWKSQSRKLRIERLREIFREKGAKQNLEKVDALLATERARFDAALERFRAQLDDELVDATLASLQERSRDVARKANEAADTAAERRAAQAERQAERKEERKEQRPPERTGDGGGRR